MKDITNQVIAVFSYSQGSLTPSVIADLLEKGVGFDVKYVYTDVKEIRSGNNNIVNRLDVLRAVDEIDHFKGKIEKDSDYPSLFVQKRISYDFLRLRYHVTQQPDIEFFNSLALIPGFNFGFIQDYEFQVWQNAADLYIYDMFGKSHKNLPKTSNGLPYPLEREVVDISGNPCRTVRCVGMEFSLSPLMWMNEAFIRDSLPELLQDKSIFLREFNLDENLICLRLMEKLVATEGELKNASNIAKKLNFDLLESKFERMRRQIPSDPMSEYNKIEVDGKAGREQVLWLDSEGNVTHKSKAIRKLVNTFDSMGKRLKAYFEDK